MEKQAAPNVGTGSPGPGNPANFQFPGVDAALNPRTLATLRDIAQRSGNLLNLYAENLGAESGTQTLDPKTVAATVQELVRQANVNPAQLFKDQSSLANYLAQPSPRT